MLSDATLANKISLTRCETAVSALCANRFFSPAIALTLRVTLPAMCSLHVTVSLGYYSLRGCSATLQITDIEKLN